MTCNDHGWVKAIAEEAKDIAISARDTARKVSSDLKWIITICVFILGFSGWMVKQSVDIIYQAGRVMERLEVQSKEIDDLKEFNEMFRRHLQGDIEASLSLKEWPPKRKKPVSDICEITPYEGV